MPGRIKTEADAFRWVIWIGAAAATVVALTLVTRPLVGALWGLALLIGATFLVVRGLRRARNAERRKVLILTEAPLDPAAVREAFAERWASEPHQVLIIAPARHEAATPEGQRERQGVELSLQAVQEAGAKAEGLLVEPTEVAMREARDLFAAAETVDAAELGLTRRAL